jgi:hypothetical protein
MAQPEATNLHVVRWLTWTGPVLITVLFGGMVMAKMMPPPSPSSSPEVITAMYVEDRNQIILGCVIMMFAWCMWATYCPAIMMMIRRTERGRPVITYTSIALIAAGAVFFCMIPLTWSVAAYRAGTVSPEITRTLNDWAWFNFLFTVPPFIFWFLLVAVAIFNDHNEKPIYPRWVAYCNIWIAILAMPAAVIGFFKTGPFAWDGIFAFWVPVVAFGIWFVVMTTTTLQAVSREERERQEDRQLVTT